MTEESSRQRPESSKTNFVRGKPNSNSHSHKQFPDLNSIIKKNTLTSHIITHITVDRCMKLITLLKQLREQHLGNGDRFDWYI